MDNRSGVLAADQTGRVAEILDDYLRQVAAGAAGDKQALLAKHPEVADALDACLASLDWIRHAADRQQALSLAQALDVGEAEADKTLGDFRLLREIGRGGMGVVYEAEQRSLSRRVALKILPFAGMLDARQRQRFQNEAHAAAQLDHPNIINVIGVGCERGVYYYAMRLVEGPTLADVVRQLRETRGSGHRFPQVVAELAACTPSPADEDTTFTRPPNTPFDLAQDSRLSLRESSAIFAERKATMTRQLDTPHDASETHAPQANDRRRGDSSTCASRPGAGFYRCVAQVGIQIARALDYAHEVGVVHRDIKPSNLMVDCHGTVWITDFGLARVEANPELTMTGDVLGTLRYMSPEQITGQRAAVDHRTDIYSLGATLYELLIWRPAFAAPQRTELLRRIATDPPLAPRKINRSVPAELETIVLKALEKDPLDRYGTAGEMADDLQRYLDNRPIRARRSRALGHLKAFWRRHQVLLMAVLVTLLVATSVASVLVWRQRQDAVAQRALVVARDADLRQRLYAADLKLAHQAWQRGDLARMKELLDRYAGAAGQEMREFAWHYLSSLLAARPAPASVLRPGHGNIYYVRFSPDGKHLAAACGGGRVIIWTVPDWSPCHDLAAHQADADCVDFSPDGKLLASGGEDGWLRLWDVETGELRQSLEAGQKDTLTVATSPDGQSLAAGGIDGLVRLWELPAGRRRAEFRVTSGRVQHLSFSPDGQKLATAGGDGTAALWDASNGKRVADLPYLGPACYAASFSPDGQTLALAGTDGVVGLANAFEGRLDAVLGKRGGKVRTVAFSPSARFLASAGESGLIELWGRGDRSLRARFAGHVGRVWSVDFSHDGQWLASAGDDGSVHLWDPSIEPRLAVARHTAPFDCAKIVSATGPLVAAADYREFMTWDAARLDRLSNHPLPVGAHQIAVSPDRRMLVLASNTGDVWLGDAATGELTSFDTGEKRRPESVSLGCLGRLLFSYSDGTLEVWDTGRKSRLDQQKLERDVSVAATSRDGRLVAFDYGPSLLLYDLDALALRIQKKRDPFESVALAFSPDRRTLAAALIDGSIALIDVATGARTGSLPGHQLWIDSMVFSPDGGALCSVGRDGRLHVWHVPTRQELFTLRQFDAAVHVALDFSSDGRYLTAATQDRDGRGRLFVWSMLASDEGATRPAAH